MGMFGMRQSHLYRLWWLWSITTGPSCGLDTSQDRLHTINRHPFIILDVCHSSVWFRLWSHFRAAFYIGLIRRYHLIPVQCRSDLPGCCYLGLSPRQCRIVYEICNIQCIHTSHPISLPYKLQWRTMAKAQVCQCPGPRPIIEHKNCNRIVDDWLCRMLGRPLINERPPDSLGPVMAASTMVS
jgi:hypothetical protein